MPLTWPLVPAHDVVILGAGFSRSLSGTMPLTDELGDQLLGYLNQRFNEPMPRPFTGGMFELWLSRLAEDQPFLWPDENLEQRATYSRCATYLADVLEERVLSCLDDALAQPWLAPMLGAYHARRSTLITFNQDTLVERAVEAAQLRSWNANDMDTFGAQPPIAWQDITGAMPSPHQRGGWYGAAPKDTFRLLKLHGSTNWYWRSGDRTGATIVAWWLHGTAKGEAAQPNEEAAKARLLPGHIPFAVPPTSAKSAYYDNPLTEALWREARNQLQVSKSVAIVGYSLPATDTVTTNLVRETLVESSPTVSTPIQVVNPDPTPIRDRLLSLGVSKERITCVGSVSEYAHALVIDTAHRLAAEMKNHHEKSDVEPVLLVGSSLDDALPVSTIDIDRDHIRLILEPVPEGQPAIGLHLRPESSPKKQLDLKAALNSRPDPCHLIAIGPTGKQAPVVAADQHLSGTYGSTTTWQVLRAAVPVASIRTQPKAPLPTRPPD